MNYFTQHAVGLFHAVISSDFMQDFSPGWWNAEVLSRSNDPKVHNQGNDQYWVKVDDGREICMRFTSELRALKACFFFPMAYIQSGKLTLAIDLVHHLKIYFL